MSKIYKFRRSNSKNKISVKELKKFLENYDDDALIDFGYVSFSADYDYIEIEEGEYLSIQVSHDYFIYYPSETCAKYCFHKSEEGCLYGKSDKDHITKRPRCCSDCGSYKMRPCSIKFEKGMSPKIHKKVGL